MQLLEFALFLCFYVFVNWIYFRLWSDDQTNELLRYTDPPGECTRHFSLHFIDCISCRNEWILNYSHTFYSNVYELIAWSWNAYKDHKMHSPSSVINILDTLETFEMWILLFGVIFLTLVITSNCWNLPLIQRLAFSTFSNSV